MKKGIDVSEFQRKINWQEAKEYIDFAILRCGFGNNIEKYDDSYFKVNSDECERLKIPYGVYLFSYATNISMAQSEVDHTLRLIKNKKLEYPVFLDVETRRQLELPKEELAKIVKYYCEKIEEAGYYVGIYASLNTFDKYLDSEELDKYDKWVAEWNKDFTYKGKSGMWQYTDNDRIKGIETRVDGDYAFYDYPTIIRENGLNHLGPEDDTVNLKYKVGDKLYLNGNLYKNEDAKESVKKYNNKQVQITEINNKKGTNAPYKLNIGGYTTEGELTEEKINNDCIFKSILNWIKNLFKSN